MRGWGRVINITGKSEPEGVNGAYCAKAALTAWSKGLSREVGRHGITVNCIPAGPHPERADPAQLHAGVPRLAVRARDPRGPLRGAGGARRPGRVPRLAAGRLHHRSGVPGRRRPAPLPILSAGDSPRGGRGAQPRRALLERREDAVRLGVDLEACHRRLLGAAARPGEDRLHGRRGVPAPRPPRCRRARLRTQPVTPRRSASMRIDSRNHTPCTRPRATRRRRDRLTHRRVPCRACAWSPPRSFLVSTRRFLEASVGRVATRFFGTWLRRTRRSTSRSNAVSRLRNWEGESWDVDHHAGGQVRDAQRRLGLVHVLAARAARAEDLDHDLALELARGRGNRAAGAARHAWAWRRFSDISARAARGAGARDYRCIPAPGDSVIRFTGAAARTENDGHRGERDATRAPPKRITQGQGEEICAGSTCRC